MQATTPEEDVVDMWDSVNLTLLTLSHDRACPRCGHAWHTYLACGDLCPCQPWPTPKLAA